MIRLKQNHLHLIQDKAKVYAYKYTNNWKNVPLIGTKKITFQPRQKEPKYLPVTRKRPEITKNQFAIVRSLKKKSKIASQIGLLEDLAKFVNVPDAEYPNTETIARFIDLQLLQSEPTSESDAIIESLYMKSILINGPPSLHLQNAILDYSLSSGTFVSSKITPSGILSSLLPIIKPSTARIIIKHTKNITNIFSLMKRLPPCTLSNTQIQILLLSKVRDLYQNDGLMGRCIQMRVLMYVKTRCNVQPETYVFMNHPHAVYLADDLRLLDTCSDGALRYLFERFKARDVVENGVLLRLWKAGKRCGDQVVCEWAEGKMGALPLRSLQNTHADVNRVFKTVEEGTDLDEALHLLNQLSV